MVRNIALLILLIRLLAIFDGIKFTVVLLFCINLQDKHVQCYCSLVNNFDTLWKMQKRNLPQYIAFLSQKFKGSNSNIILEMSLFELLLTIKLITTK